MADTGNTSTINADTINAETANAETVDGVEASNATDSVHPLPERAAFVFAHALQGNMPLVLVDTDTYHHMGEAGMLADKRVELVGGTLLDMQPISKEHAYATLSLSRQLGACLGERGIVNTQNPLSINDNSEPLPDVFVLKPPMEQYRQRLPQAEDVLLIIEVAQSSLQTDRTVKLELYARASITEYWLVNLVDGQLETHRQPDPKRGQYLETTIHYSGEKVAPKAFPDCQLAWFS